MQRLGRDQEAAGDENDHHQRLRRHKRAVIETAEGRRQHPVLAERASQAREAGDRRRRGEQQDRHAAQADEHAQRRGENARHVRRKRGDDAHQRSAPPLVTERRVTVHDRKSGEADHGDQHVDADHGADRGEQVPRQSLRIAALLREIGNGLDAGEGQHRQRQGEGERAPARRAAEVHARCQPVPGEEHRQTEHDQRDLSNQVEHGENDAEAIEAGPKGEAHQRECSYQPNSDQRVVGRFPDRREIEGGAEVVRHEERRQGDDDQVVEHQHPADHEAGHVAEGPADEVRRAARLGRGRDGLGIGESYNEEERPYGHQHGRRQAERVRRDDA